MLRQTFLFLGQLWQLFEVSQILEFLRYLVIAHNVIVDQIKSNNFLSTSINLTNHDRYHRVMVIKIYFIFHKILCVGNIMQGKNPNALLTVRQHLACTNAIIRHLIFNERNIFNFNEIPFVYFSSSLGSSSFTT